jgi:hypothetical protein
MAGERLTIYRRSANGRIEAVEMRPHEAEFAISRFPFAW